MEKCAIVTLNGYFNYGNRLQNYALQEVLNSYDFHVETIRFNRYAKKYIYKDYLRKMKNKIVNSKDYKLEKDREKIFMDFSEKNIEETENIFYKDQELNFLNKEYTNFIVGSDQVWNPGMNRTSSFFFLDFAEEEKRLSYAASFGISDIPSEYKDDYKKWLLGMNKLSVREDDGSKIIKDLTGRDASVHVDPTLLLTKEKWMTIAKEASNKPKEKYLLTYFLGGIPKEYKKQIDKIVKEKNLEVINLGDIREKETYRTGPSEFIDYIKDCSIFCTDSFHGAIFSIIFEKPFIVYERMGSSMSMYSRMETLLNKFKLEDRKFENIKNTEDAFDIDYSHVPAILEEERKKSFDYLKDALNVENRD